jgi:hypothetical protein
MLLGFGAGCAGPTMIEGGPFAGPGPLGEAGIENPVFIPGSADPFFYGKVFETSLQTLIDHGFEIHEANRYDGRIEALPRIAPGLGLFLKPGSPSLRERTLATLQTYRNRVSIAIQPAEHGGYFVEVIVRKELEDLERPTRATAGSAVFVDINNVARQFEVIDATVVDSHWIYKGRDQALEQCLIDALKKCL